MWAIKFCGKKHCNTKMGSVYITYQLKNKNKKNDEKETY